MSEFNEDRAALLPLIEALDASPRALQRDLVRGESGTGDWAICGSLGHIYPDGAGYLRERIRQALDERQASARLVPRYSGRG
jgi:hypothetical protein